MIFYATYAIWILSEIYLNRFMRSGKGDKKGKDARSLSMIWVTILVAVGFAVYISMHLALPMGRNDFVSYAGLCLMMAGILFRFVAIMSLGRFFTVDVTIREGHQLKMDGLYRHLRHPSYTGSFLTFIGFGFTLNNWASMLLLVMPIFLAFRHRIRVEEKVLEEQFGDAYSRYRAQTDAMIPLIF
jgi:protein-S-isoprenylcysteine O-methyltransferase Ste14